MHGLVEEAKREEKRRRDAIQQLDRRREELVKKQREYAPEQDVLPIDHLAEGDMVFVRSLGYDGRVIEINYKQERVRVQAGTVEVEVPAADLAAKKGRAADSSRPSERWGPQLMRSFR